MKRLVSLFVSISIFLLTGCQQEETCVDISTVEKVNVTVPVRFMIPESITDDQGMDRSGNVPLSSNADFQLRTIHSSGGKPIQTRAIQSFGNTWILAFASDGRCQVCTNMGNISPDVPLTAQLPQGANQTLYVLSNGPSTLTTPADLNAFESNAYFSSESYANESGLPYIGKVTGISIDAGGRLSNAAGTDVRISLKRMVAKLSITCNLSVPDYRIASVRLHNAPTKMYYVYANTSGEISADAREADNISGSTYTWFTGENIRGNGSSSNQFERYAGKAPASSTFIRVSLESTISGETVAYDIYPGKDLNGNYDLSRNWDYIYTTTFTKSGSQLSSDKRVVVEGTPIDLTGVPSNCYILSPGLSYRIDPCIKGEGQSEMGGVTNMPINHTVSNMHLIWQDTPSLVQSIGLAGDKKSAVVNLNPSLEGNALIAASENGQIVWCWHLWVRSKPLNWYTTSGIRSMSCNLGALNGTNVDSSGPNSLGLLYQWGRSIPFPGASAVDANTVRPVYDIDNNIVTIITFEGPQYVNVSVSCPTYLFYSEAKEFSWHRDGDDLWGNSSGTKSIFDPSPRGWRVPVDHTLWEGWTTDVNSDKSFTWNPGNPSRTSHNDYYERDLFPAAGAYVNTKMSEPTLFDVGFAGMYWCSIVDGTKGGLLRFTADVEGATDDDMIQRTTMDQSYACSVRPVKY